MGMGLRCPRERSAINLLTAKLFLVAFPCLIRKNMAHFQNPPAKLLNTTKKTNFRGSQPCVCTLIDHGQRPITARSIDYIILYNLLLIIKCSQSAREK